MCTWRLANSEQSVYNLSNSDHSLSFESSNYFIFLIFEPFEPQQLRMFSAALFRDNFGRHYPSGCAMLQVTSCASTLCLRSFVFVTATLIDTIAFESCFSCSRLNWSWPWFCADVAVYGCSTHIPVFVVWFLVCGNDASPPHSPSPLPFHITL